VSDTGSQGDSPTPASPTDERREVPLSELSPRARRWLGIVTIAGVLLVAVRAALPFAAEWALESRGARALGVPVRVADVDLSLLGTRAVLLGVDVGPAGEEARVRWERLEVDLAWTQLLLGTVRVSRVELERPRIALRQRADGRVELPFPGPPAAEPEGPEGKADADGGPAAVPEATAEGPDGSEAAVPGDAGAAEPQPEAGEPWPIEVERVALDAAELRLLQPGAADSLVVGLAHLGVDDVHIEGSRIALGSVALRRPTLRLVRAQVPSGLAQADPAPGPEAAAAPAGPGEAGPAAPGASADSAAPADSEAGLRIENARLESGVVLVLGERRPLEARFLVSASDVTTQPWTLFPVNVQIDLQGGASVSLEGRAGVAPPQLDARLRWRGLDVPRLLEAAHPALVPGLRSGETHGDLALRVAVMPAADGRRPPLVRAAGRLGVADLGWGDASPGGFALDGARADATIGELVVPADGPTRIRADSLAIEGPVLSLARAGAPDDGGDGDAPDPEDAPPEPAAEATAEEGGEPAFVLDLASAEIGDGEVVWTDRALDPPLVLRARDLGFRGQDLHWPAARAQRLEASAAMPGNASFSISGGLAGEQAVRIQLENLPLEPLGPYASRYAGYRIQRGAFSLDTRLRGGEGRYAARNDVVLHDLRLAAEDPGAFQSTFGISLDLGLALLRDRQGNIDLAFPVSFDEGALDWSLLGLVRQAFQKAVLNALTSPLRALGAVIGADGRIEDWRPRPVAFAPGTLDPTPAGREEIRDLAATLAARPELGVVLRGRIDDADRASLRRRRLLEIARSDERELPDVAGESLWDEIWTEGQVIDALEKRVAGEEAPLDPEDEALLEKMLAAVEVPEARVAELATARAAAVRDLLERAPEVAPGQVRVEEGFGEGPGGVHLELVARGS